jgi:hypothetical protein
VGSSAIFDCRRCGLPITLWGGLCGDCQAVVSALGEGQRWRSDYSRDERVQMGARLRRGDTNVGGAPTDIRPARRDQPQRHGPLDLSPWDVPEVPEWAEAARRRLAVMPPAPAVIQHGVGGWGAEECINGHPYDAANTRVESSGRKRCKKCDAERAARRRRNDRQEAS